MISMDHPDVNAIAKVAKKEEIEKNKKNIRSKKN
jgi:hypothetical protein